jgi:hypothetical protein
VVAEGRVLGQQGEVFVKLVRAYGMSPDASVFELLKLSRQIERHRLRL